MKEYIGCDAHKKYSVFVAVDEQGHAARAVRVEHDREVFRKYLADLPEKSPIAVEATGHWYWIADAMEAAGHQVHLTNAGEAKKRMGGTHKTDRLDARGLGMLLRNGTLPEVWIPPAELRDQRDLLRTRMALVAMRTALKNRIHGALDRYGIQREGISDLFGGIGRKHLELCLEYLPEETRYTTQQQAVTLDQIDEQIEKLEARIERVIEPSEGVRWLKSLPGVGAILGPLIALEVGKVERFPGPGHLASYAGLVARTISSGGHTRHGKVSQNVNRYLKWAFVEAANVIVMQQKKMAGRHVVKLYQRLRGSKGHAKAVTAVARHLAEASYWVLKNQEIYRDPAHREVAGPAAEAAASVLPG